MLKDWPEQMGEMILTVVFFLNKVMQKENTTVMMNYCSLAPPGEHLISVSVKPIY